MLPILDDNTPLITSGYSTNADSETLPAQCWRTGRLADVAQDETERDSHSNGAPMEPSRRTQGESRSPSKLPNFDLKSNQKKRMF